MSESEERMMEAVKMLADKIDGLTAALQAMSEQNTQTGSFITKLIVGFFRAHKNGESETSTQLDELFSELGITKNHKSNKRL